MGGYFYPQASVVLRVRWEDFNDKQNEKLQKVYELPVLVRNVIVNINDYTQADTFELEVEYKNFPFDPRSIRACGVKVFMQNMGKFFSRDNSLEQIVPDYENCVFMGFADEESISFDDMKRTVRFEGRDFTGLLVDRPYPHGTVNVEQKLDVVLMQILGSLPETKELKLDNRVWDGDLPILSKFWGEKNALSGQMNVHPDKTYWDVIQDIVSRAGLIAYIELDKLVLTKPRVMYDKSRAAIFVFGRNLSNLSFKRKVGRMKGFNVIVRCMNLNTKEVLEAKIPAEATAEWSKDTGIPNKEVTIQTLKPDGTPVDVTKGGARSAQSQKPEVAPYMSFRVADVADKPHLIAIGEKIFEEISRQQLDGEFETKDMDIPYGALQDGRLSHVERFNVLKLRVGTPVRMEVSQGDLKGISRLTDQASRERFLIARGYRKEVASAFAESIGRHDSTFYTKSVSFTVDAEQGFHAKVNFINFIELPPKLAGGG